MDNTSRTPRQHPEQPGSPATAADVSAAGLDGIDAFDIVRDGYDRHQVEAHLAFMRSELAIAQTAAESARAALAQGRPGFDALGERVGQILELAQIEADELRHEVETETTRLREEAATETTRLRELATEETEELRAQTRQEVEQQLAQAKQDAARVKADATLAAEQKKHEAEREAAAARKAASAEADRTIVDALREAEALRSAAQQATDAMSEMRRGMLAELAGVRETINKIMGAADQEPAFEPAPSAVPSIPRHADGPGRESKRHRRDENGQASNGS
ncbi:MAG: hypothetical protein ACXWMN_04555 [Candidatus Limnocylindria bacterium]